MIEFIAGFILGIVFTIMVTPFVIRWFVKKKFNDVTGGFFE